MSPHLEPGELGMLAGLAAEPEADLERLLDHLAECDRCCDRFDALWQAGAEPRPPRGPEPDADSVRRIERRLFSRIHRTEAGRQVAWLATEGLMGVLLALAGPLLESPRGDRRRAPRTLKTEGVIMRRRSLIVLACAAIAALASAPAVEAGQFTSTFDFVLDEWKELESSDGPITLHRLRLDLIEGRLTKSSLARFYNQEYLETVRFQLDYSNGSSSKWNARVEVRWLDKDGKVIDGISANEKLEKKSARKITQVSLSTLKYGLERARKMEVEIHYEP